MSEWPYGTRECGSCRLWRPILEDERGPIGPCRLQVRTGDFPGTAPVCERYLARDAAIPQAAPPEPERRRRARHLRPVGVHRTGEVPIGSGSATTWAWGDTNNANGVDIFDILCVLDGSQNKFVKCTLHATDLRGPTPDGVIDPAKVTRGALENAASIAAMILTTEALITDVPEKEKAPMMPPGGGGMDY